MKTLTTHPIFRLKHAIYDTGGKKDYMFDDDTPQGAEELARPGFVYTIPYQYKYQGQERQDELGLNWDSFKWRNYDYAIGRFMNIDPLAESYAYQSVYSFSSNQPVHAPELEGLESASDLNKKAYNEKSAHSSVPNWLAFRAGAPYQWTNSARVVAGNFATRGESKEAKTPVLKKDGPVQGKHRDRGSKQGAYRHALWQALITQEFSRSDAKLVGDAHEGGAVDVSQYKNISGIFQADQVADELNNRIGRNYGAENNDQSWGEIAIGVLNIFKEEGLYTISQNDDGTFNVKRTKITEKEYKQLSERFQNLNNNGRDTDPEDKKRIQRVGE